MKSRAELDQRGNAPVEPDAAAVRIEDPAHQLEQSRFAAAVLADQTDRLTRLDRQRDAVEDGALLIAPPFSREQLFLERLSPVGIDAE